MAGMSAAIRTDTFRYPSGANKVTIRHIRWPDARLLKRPSGTWELIGDRSRCAHADGVDWYWCALRRVGGPPRIYNGVIRRPPLTADEGELVPELEEVVRRCRQHDTAFRRLDP